MCYLAEELAKRKHEVVLFTLYKKESYSRGVRCYPISKDSRNIVSTLDVLVVQNSAAFGPDLKAQLNDKTKIILWTQHAHDQPAVKCLNEKKYCDVYDAVVVISEWQKDCYQKTFPIKSSKYSILRNAISPKFENLFLGQKNILDVKTIPPVLTYTSTPFRGLDILIKLFPIIKVNFPGIKLKIFSSMKVYQATNKEDKEKFGHLYKLCNATPGIKYVGSIAQTKLAKELHDTLILAYPNSYAETSCISVMEAMAAGCIVITSNLGALPETTAGFAKLVKVDGDWEKYMQRYFKSINEFLQEFNSELIL
jgi:glycosyltransferase involved in cell wall biosynthesis